MAKAHLKLWALICFVSMQSFAANNESLCPNCEAMVELDPAHAEQFASAVQIISSIPLRGTIVHPGSSRALAKVLVSTWPNWQRGNSFDVANKILAFAETGEYGIKTITAVWNAQEEKL